MAGCHVVGAGVQRDVWPDGSDQLKGQAMTTLQSADGSSSTAQPPQGRQTPKRGVRLTTIILTAVSAAVAIPGLAGFVAAYLFPMPFPLAIVRILALAALALVPGAALAVIAAAFALSSRAGRLAGCALGTLLLCLVSIAAGVYLHSDFSLRQRLAARLCKPGYRLTFSCRDAGGPAGVPDARTLEAVRQAVVARLDPRAFGVVRVEAAPPDRIVAALDKRAFPRDPEFIEGCVRLIERRGVLEFRVLPTTDRAELSAAEIEQYIEALADRGPESASDSKYVWVEIKSIADWHNPYSVVGQAGDSYYVLASNRPDEIMLHEPDGGGWRLKNACPTTDGVGRRAIGFTLDRRGGDLFWNLTRSNGDRPLAIVLDNVAISAPLINPEAPIRDKGIITGSFTASEVTDMVRVLDGDPLPIELRLVESLWLD